MNQYLSEPATLRMAACLVTVGSLGLLVTLCCSSPDPVPSFALAKAPQATPVVAQPQRPSELNPTGPVVLLDSFHAHNFIDRGLIPGEHTYHRITGLRRATAMLTDRGVALRELMIGPITPNKLEGVQLIVLNLPSMDRPPWLTSEIETVEKFIRQGGGMVFITDHTNCYYHQYHLLPLWQRLGLIPTFETACEQTVKNRLSPTGSGWLLIRDFTQHPLTHRVNYFGTQTGGRLVGDGIVARTSPDAWADAGLSPLYGEGNPGLTGDLRRSDSEEHGPQGIILAKAIERGRVVVIADQNCVGDAQISYADNWRLWLNACNWAGKLDIETGELKLDQLAQPWVQPRGPVDPRPSTSFDDLVGQEPDQNAQPQLPPGSWQVECWEPLAVGNFRWGGTEDQQYYYFWCWLNRWCWASAHQRPSNPLPSGRVMLLACQPDLADAQLKQRIDQLHRLGGKLVVLGSEAAMSKPSVTQETPPARAGWLKEQLALVVPESELPQLLASAAWRIQPLEHAVVQWGGLNIQAIPVATMLQNAEFTSPEQAPDAMQSKWQRRLYHWLFEQP